MPTIGQIIVFVKKSKLVLLLYIFIVYTVVLSTAAVFSLVQLYKTIDAYVIPNFDLTFLQTVKKTRFRNVLNGSIENLEQSVLAKPLAVVVDNSIFAGAQFGIDKADIVIEYPVEGGITRFLAIFNQAKKIDKIGPVRSARPYIIDFAAGLGSVFAHSGGSPTALDKLAKNLEVINVDEIGPDGRWFWRDKTKLAPHNLFTSTNLLKKALAVKSVYIKKSYKDLAWKWQNIITNPVNKAKHPSIIINYSTSPYKVEYIYNNTLGNYKRLQGGEYHKTAAGEQIFTNNIVVVYTRATVLDSQGRLEIQTTGTNAAVVCKQGECFTAMWEKEKTSSRFKFIDAKTEKVIPLLPGKTWIQIVPIGKIVEY